MSDIRFNQWLHQSGTGGVTQLSSGHVGIGTTNPLIPVHSGNNAVLNVGVVTANNIYAGTLNGTLALSDISGITGSFTSNVSVNGNLDIVDKIRHIGDTNTAIRFPANDTVTIETNGSAKFHIDSTGRISSGNDGVGTYNDASEWFKVQSNNSAANISIVGSNATHSSLNLGDEDDFNIQKIRSDHTNNSLQFFTDNTERFRITSGGQVNIGGDYTQTSSTLFLKGGSASSGNVNLLELKHSDTASSTSGGGAGDGPAMLFNGFYSGNPWQFAKVCSVNSGSGYGAAFQIHVHPSDGNQAANLVKAVTIVGNGSAGSVTIHNGTLHTTYNGSSMYGAQINDSQTSGTHIQFQRQGYNNGNITHSTNSCSYNTSGSDRTLKKNFEDWTENTLDLFKSLKPQKFHFIIDNDSDPKSKGYIAQDLVDSFPEAYPKEVKSQKYMFNPSGMVVYLMKALQEEIAKREELEARITDLEGS